MVFKNTINEIKFNNIFIRQTIVYKNKEIFDIESFKNINYTIEHPKWDNTTIFLHLNIKDSIHNLFLQDKKKYKHLYEKYITQTDQYEHSVQNFTNLYDNFDLKTFRLNKAKLYKEKKIFKSQKFIILDGVHRLTAYYNKINNEKVSSIYLEIN